jgi:hypothetical protein
VKLRQYRKVKRQTASFPTPTNTDATSGGGTEVWRQYSMIVSQHQSNNRRKIEA